MRGRTFSVRWTPKPSGILADLLHKAIPAELGEVTLIWVISARQVISAIFAGGVSVKSEHGS